MHNIIEVKDIPRNMHGDNSDDVTNEDLFSHSWLVVWMPFPSVDLYAEKKLMKKQRYDDLK